MTRKNSYIRRFYLTMKLYNSRTLILLSIILFFTINWGINKNIYAQETDPKATIEIGSLKGPTTMGMVKLMNDSEQGLTKNIYHVSMYGTADEIVTGIVSGKLDAAAVPCNLSSVLYNKTNEQVQVAAINTLGVLYIVESGNSIQSVADLKGKTIYSTGKGTTPEFALNYVLTQNGLEPGKDVSIEYKSESTELAVLLGQSDDMIALLPQPYVTAVQMKNEKVRIALDLSKEWEKVSTDSAMVTGCVVVRKDFIEQSMETFGQYLADYEASTQYVNTNVESAAELIAKYEIVAAAPIAVKALPFCNITFIAGDEMEKKLGGYLQVLFNANPQSIGGKLPDEAFYYKTK